MEILPISLDQPRSLPRGLTDRNVTAVVRHQICGTQRASDPRHVERGMMGGARTSANEVGLFRRPTRTTTGDDAEDPAACCHVHRLGGLITPHAFPCLLLGSRDATGGACWTPRALQSSAALLPSRLS